MGTLATAGADGVVKVWDFPGGERRKNIEGYGKEVTSIQFIGVTDQALTSAGDSKVRLVRDNGSDVRAFTGCSDFVYAAAATPDGSVVIAGGLDGVCCGSGMERTGSPSRSLRRRLNNLVPRCFRWKRWPVPSCESFEDSSPSPRPSPPGRG